MYNVKIIADTIFGNTSFSPRATTFELEYPRYILAELLTHRVFSRNSASCLTGDTLVYIEKPSFLSKGYKMNQPMRIDDIVNKWFSGDSLGRSMQTRLKELNLRHLNEETGEYDTVHIKDCFKQGKQEVYKITLADGKQLTCTKNHRLLSEDGWITLNDLKLTNLGEVNECAWSADAPRLAVNGATYSKQFLSEERDSGKTLRQICIEQNYAEKSARYFCEKHNIKFAKTITTPDESLEYKNKSWLIAKKELGYTNGFIAELCSTTEDRVKKSCKKLGVVGYTGKVLKGGNSRTPWNTGLKYNLPEESLVTVRAAAKRRIKTDSYKAYKDENAAITRFLQESRKSVFEKYRWKCQISGSNQELELHHIDPVWHNKELVFEVANLMPLTKEMHRYIHNNNLDLAFLDWIKSGQDACDFVKAFDGVKKTCDGINKPKSPGNTLVMRYMEIIAIEFAGEQETYDLEVEGSHHNFVANGIVVHNSRAIPITKMIEQATHNTVMPIWTNNQSGMQGEVITHGRTIQKANEVMLNMLSAVAAGVELLSELGVHKQNANRYLEPFQHIKTVLTGTDFENFFALRFHKDAQPEIAQLATEMYAHYKRSKPRKASGSPHTIEAWHLPYAEGISELKDAQAVSASCCAQVSYRNQDTSIDKALVIYDKLVKSKPAHYSPFEHQCMLRPDNKLQKGNLKGLYQYRQHIEEEQNLPF